MTALLRKYRRILTFALPEWPALAAIVALAVLTSLLAALQPWPLKLLVDYGLGETAIPAPLETALLAVGIEANRMVLVVLGALFAGVVFAASTALDAGLTMAWSIAGQRMVYRLASALFMQLQRLSLIFHARRTVGDALSRVTGDAWSVYAVTEGVLIAPVQNLLVVVFVGAMAWHLDPALTLLMLAAVPLLALSAFYFGHRLKGAERLKRESAAQLSAFVHQVLGAMPVVQSFAAAPRNHAMFFTHAQAVERAARNGAWLTHAYATVNGVALTLGIVLVVYAGGRQVLANAMTLGSLLVFIAYVRALEGAWRSLFHTYGALRGAEASVDRVLEVLDAQEAVREGAGARVLPARGASASCGELVFDQVTFGYEPKEPVLAGLSLEIRAGETLALVGESGAGKSTLASMVPRFFDPWQGRVLLDGMDLRDAQLASLRGEIALVLQDPFILPLSVIENIAYGRPGASRDDVVAAAVAANAHEFIRTLPQGYDTMLGEQGATLSGGQRQRLAIARALLKDPRVLVLDEPTSALDSATEQLVVEALGRLRAGRTTLIIAHRLATLRGADRIAVLAERRIVELGTHLELLAAGGRYARLYAMSAFGTAAEVPR